VRPAVGVRRPGQVLGEYDTVGGWRLDRGDAGSFVDPGLDVVELADVVVGGAAGGDVAVLGHRDPTGVDSGHRVDRRGHDLGEDLFQIADAASGDQVPSGAAQREDERVGLVGLHGVVPPSRTSAGCST